MATFETGICVEYGHGICVEYGHGRVLSVPDIMAMYSQQMEGQPALTRLLAELGNGPVCLCYSPGHNPTEKGQFVFADVFFDQPFAEGRSTSAECLSFDDFAALPTGPQVLKSLPEGVCLVPSRILHR